MDKIVIVRQNVRAEGDGKMKTKLSWLEEYEIRQSVSDIDNLTRGMYV